MRICIIMLTLALTASIFASSDNPLVTIQGELVLVDCAVMHQYSDNTLQFSHMSACLARVKNDHGRLLLLLPLPQGQITEINFGLIIGKTYYRLTDITPRNADNLLHALRIAATDQQSLYVSIVSPPPLVDASGNKIKVVTIDIQKTRLAPKQTQILN